MAQLELTLQLPELQPTLQMLLGVQLNQDRIFLRILTETGKSYSLRRPAKKPKKMQKTGLLSMRQPPQTGKPKN